jgi:fatty acid desaturase
MIDLHKYKDLFGKPNEGLRKYRIFNIAIYDVTVTVVIVYAISYFTKWSFWPSLIFVFVFYIGPYWSILIICSF